MTSNSKTVLLAGATGYIGRAVAAELTTRGYRVVAIVRGEPDPGTVPELTGCEFRVAKVTDADNLKQALNGLHFDAVVSCIASRNGEPADAWNVDYQANGHLLSAAKSAGANHFVLLSAICVQKPKLAFQHAKLAFEQELTKSGINYSIVRPTAFFKSLSGQVDRVRRGKSFIVFGDGAKTACKPISAKDLANYVIDCLNKRALQNRVLPIGGPGDALTPRQQGELLFELAGMPPKFKHAPVGIFHAAIAVLAPLGKLSSKLKAKSELARIGRYYATESMLVWDAQKNQYDAAATPATGSQSLRDHYARMLREGLQEQELGEHKLF